MSVRLLIVDDSVVVRSVLESEMARQRDIEVVGTARDAFEARDAIVALRPDVITLDIEMPGVDGLTFLRRLMRFYPLPVVVVSSLTRRGGARALEALDLGAVDVMCKPSPGFGLAEIAEELADRVRAAARARLDPDGACEAEALTPVRLEGGGGGDFVVAIGASTGGPRTLARIVSRWPADFPAVLITQHMAPGFTASFAERLDRECAMEVREARDGDAVRRGLCLIAPGDRHMILRSDPTRGRWVEVRDGPRVCGHRPSVDVLFRSVARYAGERSCGVLLTGMGDDGARGLCEMLAAGAATLAEHESSAVIWGMPRAAIARGAAEHVCAADDVAPLVSTIAGGVTVAGAGRERASFSEPAGSV